MKRLAMLAMLASQLASAGDVKLSLPKPRQAEVFVHALHATDPTLRRVALEQLRELADQPAVQKAAPAISAIAQDAHAKLDEREAAMWVLFALPAHSVNAEPFWPLIKAPQQGQLSGIAALVLAKHGTQPDKLAQYLLVWVKMPGSFTSDAAAGALGLLGPAVLPTLRARLARGESAGILRALAEMGPPAAPALPDLYTRLDAEKGYEREQVRDAIETIEGGPSIALVKHELAHSDRDTLRWVEHVLPKLKPADARPLLEPILSVTTPDDSGLLLNALEPFITPADGALVAKHCERMLGSHDSYTASVAADLLAAAGTPGRAVLTKAIQHGPMTGQIAALHVATNADADQVDALARAGDPSVRKPALEALGRLHAHEATLISATSDPSVRSAAISGLGHVPTQRSVATLVGLLRDKDKSVRTEAADAIAALGRAGADAVLPLLAARDQLEMREASQLIAKLGPATLPALEKVLHIGKTEDRLDAVMAMLAMGPKAAPAAHDLVEAATSDRDERVRSWAIRTLARVGATSALPDLESALVDPSAEVVQAAAAALTELGMASPAGRKQLVALASHDKLASSDALRAIIKLGVTADDFPLLRTAIKNDRLSSEARREAITVLVTARDSSPATLEVLRFTMHHSDTAYIRGPSAEALLALGNDADLTAAIVVLDGNDKARGDEDTKAFREMMPPPPPPTP